MGRYCTTFGSEIDPCCEGRDSTFAKYGAGVTVFFKNLKMLTCVFFIMSVCMLPALLLNVYGPGTVISYDTLSLSSTMVGNLNVPSNATSFSVPGWKWIMTNYASGSYADGVPIDTAALVYSLCDVAATIFLIAAYLWAVPMEEKEERLVNKATVTADDYTIFIPHVAPETREEHLREYIAKLTHDADHDAAVLGHPNLFRIAEVHVVMSSTQCLGSFIERGKKLKLIERVSEQIKRLSLEIEHGNSGNFCFPLTAQLNRLNAVKARLVQEAENLARIALVVASQEAVSAFVTFERGEARDWVIEQYSGGFAGWLCQEDNLRLHGRRVKLIEAPPPSSIMWANLHFSSFNRCVRQTTTLAICLAMLSASFLLLWFASWKQNQYTQSSKLQSCTAALISDYNTYSNVTQTNALAKMSTDSSILYCWCSSTTAGAPAWATMSLTQLTNAVKPATWPANAATWVVPGSTSTGSTFPASMCPYQVCPRWFELDVSGVWNQDYCVQWVTGRSVTIGLLIAAAVAVLIINTGLGEAMRFLTVFEGHSTVDNMNTSLAFRLFSASFLNTAALVVLINIAWPWKVSDSEGYLTGSYSDFTTGWYQTVGTALVTTMLINIGSPHVYWILAACYFWRTTSNPDLTAPTQRELNEKMVGPGYDWALRYAIIYNTLFVCYTFSAGMPIMIPIAFVSFAIFYYIEKVLFLWYYRKPPSFGAQMQMAMTRLLPVSIILHLAFGVWQLSGVASFKTAFDPLNSQKYASQIVAYLKYKDSTYTEGLSRVTATAPLPLLVLLIIIVAYFITKAIMEAFGKFFVIFFHFVTCHSFPHVFDAFQKRGKSGDWVVDQLSFTEAVKAAKEGTDGKMSGMLGYNILLNEEIQSACAVSPAFAEKHHTLEDIANDRSSYGS